MGEREGVGVVVEEGIGVLDGKGAVEVIAQLWVGEGAEVFPIKKASVSAVRLTAAVFVAAASASQRFTVNAPVVRTAPVTVRANTAKIMINASRPPEGMCLF